MPPIGVVMDLQIEPRFQCGICETIQRRVESRPIKTRSRDEYRRPVFADPRRRRISFHVSASGGRRCHQPVVENEASHGRSVGEGNIRTEEASR